MTTPDQQRQLLGAFAQLLAYPAADAVPAARRCRALLGARAGDLLDPFVARAEQAGPHELEELYSSTFDLDPACAPYVGHQLCGEGPQRGVFMARLADVYRQDGFQDEQPGRELPDHLTVVLRYLAAAPEGPSRTALLEDGLVPALDKMLATPFARDDAYRAVLAALREEVA